MDFKDYIGDLEGKLVLYERGSVYGGTIKSIREITKETKTGFRIFGSQYLFDIDTGVQKGLTGKMNMGAISKCSLITKDEAKRIKQKWFKEKENQQLKVKIKELLNTRKYDTRKLKVVYKILLKK